MPFFRSIPDPRGGARNFAGAHGNHQGPTGMRSSPSPLSVDVNNGGQDSGVATGASLVTLKIVATIGAAPVDVMVSAAPAGMSMASPAARDVSGFVAGVAALSLQAVAGFAVWSKSSDPVTLMAPCSMYHSCGTLLAATVKVAVGANVARSIPSVAAPDPAAVTTL